MSRSTRPFAGAALAVAAACGSDPAPSGDVIPLKEAKLNIEHNATDEDTGFQGVIDSEGWGRLDVVAPSGEVVLQLAGRGPLAELGVTELFFETVEPANADVPLDEMLAKLPEGEYTVEGPAIEDGEHLGTTAGTAWLSHTIPAGPVLMAPAEGATVPTAALAMRWGAVTETIRGGALELVGYQLIVETDGPPPPHAIGKPELSMYLPPTTTEVTLPAGFLVPATAYAWEVLAIEVSGNQTLSSGTFATE
jgi:hypothetical protein